MCRGAGQANDKRDLCVWCRTAQDTVSALGLQSVTVERLQLVQLYVTDLGICVKHLMPTNLNAVFLECSRSLQSSSKIHHGCYMSKYQVHIDAVVLFGLRSAVSG